MSMVGIVGSLGALVAAGAIGYAIARLSSPAIGGRSRRVPGAGSEPVEQFTDEQTAAMLRQFQAGEDRAEAMPGAWPMTPASEFAPRPGDRHAPSPDTLRAIGERFASVAAAPRVEHLPSGEVINGMRDIEQQRLQRLHPEPREMTEAEAWAGYGTMRLRSEPNLGRNWPQ